MKFAIIESACAFIIPMLSPFSELNFLGISIHTGMCLNAWSLMSEGMCCLRAMCIMISNALRII